MSHGLTRRNFLAWTAATASGLSLFAGSTGGRRMKISLNCGALGVRVSFSEAVELAARYGFEAVTPDVGALVSMSDAEIDELKQRLADHGLVLGAAGLPVEFRKDADTFRSGLDRLSGAAEALRKAGCSRMGTWILPGSAELTYLQNFRLHTERLTAIAGVLDKHGILLGLEYVAPRTSWMTQRFPFIRTMAETKDLIREIGRPNVGFVLDSWHWWHAEETEQEILSLRNEEVVVVDLNDAPEGIPKEEQLDSKRRLPAATGVIPVKEFLGALVQIGYDGPVRAEPFDDSLARLQPEKAVAETAEAMKRAFSLIGG